MPLLWYVLSVLSWCHPRLSSMRNVRKQEEKWRENDQWERPRLTWEWRTASLVHAKSIVFCDRFVVCSKQLGRVNILRQESAWCFFGHWCEGASTQLWSPKGLFLTASWLLIMCKHPEDFQGVGVSNANGKQKSLKRPHTQFVREIEAAAQPWLRWHVVNGSRIGVRTCLVSRAAERESRLRRCVTPPALLSSSEGKLKLGC